MTESGEVTDRASGGMAGWRGLQAAAVLLVLGFFLFTLRGVLNPLLLLFVLWAVLLPFRGRSGHTALLVTAGLLTVIWSLATAGSVLAPFVLSFVLAYILDPVVDVLERGRLPRLAAILVLTVPALGLVAALIFLVVPHAVAQLVEVLHRTPELFQRLADFAETSLERLATADIPLIDEADLIERLRAVDSETVVAFLQERREALAGWAWGGFLGIGRGLSTVLTIGSYLFLTPVLTFYLLRDWDTMTAKVRDLLPAHRREGIVSFTKDFDHLLSRYLRGQITVAIIIGTLTGMGLWIAQFPYAATLGFIVTLFSVVPYLGLILSLVPAILIALVSGPVWISLVKVAVVYGVAQGLEGAVVSPRIVGDSVGLHPVWVVLALAMGGFFFGFVGLLIAVPAAVGVKLVIQRGLERYKASDFYAGEAEAAGG